MSKKLIPAVGFADDSKHTSKDDSMEEVIQEVKQENIKESKPDFLLTKQKRIKQEQLSVRINELIWEWLDKTYRASGRGKNELVERALVQLLPSKLMPKELKDILPSDYFEKI